MLQAKQTVMLVHYPAPRNTAIEIVINNNMYAALKDVKSTLAVEFHGIAGIGTSAEDAKEYVLMYAITDPYDDMRPTTSELEEIILSVKKIDKAITTVSFQDVPDEEPTLKFN